MRSSFILINKAAPPDRPSAAQLREARQQPAALPREQRRRADRRHRQQEGEEAPLHGVRRNALLEETATRLLSLRGRLGNVATHLLGPAQGELLEDVERRRDHDRGRAGQPASAGPHDDLLPSHN